ncbi:IS3 family transposase [Streptomyces sp. DSM 40976]|nr:IS3 family transposase [Streptomyces sp. DSM 40976]
MIRFRFVDEHRNAHKVKRMCDVLGWDRSGYYTWHQYKEARQEKAEEEEGLAHRIREIHTDSRGAYGALRITRKLRDQGHVVNRKRVARIMREREIVGITRRMPRSLTRQDRAARPAPDLILRDFTAPMPGLKFVGDITCLPTVEGWLYLATVIDLCTREVVGWSMAGHMRTELVADAIRMAHEGGHTSGQRDLSLGSRVAIHLKPIPCPAGRVGHPAEHRTYRFVLRQRRRGELLRRPESRDRYDRLVTRAQARQDVFRWIAEHYNRGRIHSTIGYITPYQERLRRHQRLDLAA